MPSPNLPTFVPEDVVFESFTFPFFDLNYGCDPTSLVSSFLLRPDTAPDRGKRGLYIHIPFCDTLCSFCPFIKSVGTPKRVAEYLQALFVEIDSVCATAQLQSWQFDAVYIGGGTPSVLTPEQITSLMRRLRGAFNIRDGAEITIEVEPKSASEEFCLAARESGCNRISFGVQTLDPQLRKLMNLTASLDQVYELVARSKRLFPTVNFDMIVGYPGQQEADVVRDMRAALALGVGNVSLYPLDYIATMPSFLDKIREGKVPAPPRSEERWRLFHVARSILAETYVAQNMYNFGVPGSKPCTYMFEILYGGYFDQCIGLGAGAYTMVKGLAYMNSQSEHEYVSKLQTGASVVARASPGQAYEKSYVYMAKRLWASTAEADELGISATILPKLEALEAAGLLSRTDREYRLTSAGEAVYAQMMIGLLSDAQRRLYERACARMADQLNWGLDGASSAERAKMRGMAARSSLAVAVRPE